MVGINKKPTFSSTTVGTTPATLFTAVFGNGTHACRRNVRVVNKDATKVIAILFYQASASDGSITGSGDTIASGMQIMPGDTVEFSHDATLRLGIVADGAAAAFNAMQWEP